MRELYTEIVINASPKKVWDVLTNFQRYPHWNPFIKQIQGVVKEGEKLRVRIQLPGLGTRTFTPTIVKVEPRKELSWLGRLWFAGLFDGQHTFTIEAIEDSQIKFVHREFFSGLLVPFFWRRLHENTLVGFVKMNEAIKEVAEDQSHN